MHDLDHPEDEGHVREHSIATVARRFLPLLAPEARRIAAGGGLLLLGLAADLASPQILRRLVDDDIPAGSTGGIAISAAAFLALFLVARAAGLLQVSILAQAGLGIVTALKERTFAHLLNLSMDHFEANPVGRLLARVESDGERLLALFSEVGAAIVGTILLLGGTVVLLFATDPRIAVWVLAILAPITAANIVFVRYLRPYYQTARREYARLTGFLAEYVQAVPVIQAYGIEGVARARLAERNRARLRADLSSAFREYPYWGALQGVEVAIVAAVLWLGSRASGPEALSVGLLVLFVEYVRRLFQPLVQFSEQLNFVQRALASADRVLAVLDTPTRTPDLPDARDEVPGDWAELSFEDVSFAYPGTERPAVDGVSFRVRRGETVALVGVSGGGKTTLASLLLRFHDPRSGRIALDGTDIRRFRKRAWRRRIGLVMQDVQLFPGTVAENLRVFSAGGPDDVPDAAVRTSLEVVDGLSIVDRLPGGIETELAEGGGNLSVGERQVLCFARAVVRDPEILVLDEATSSVDPATERRLQDSLARLLAGRTAIVIAHRLETVRRADRIVALHGGRVVESGTHDDLMAAGGLYRELVELQMLGVRAGS